MSTRLAGAFSALLLIVPFGTGRARAQQPAEPPPPRAECGDSNQVRLSWPEVSGAIGYKIERLKGFENRLDRVFYASQCPITNVFIDTEPKDAASSYSYKIYAIRKGGAIQPAYPVALPVDNLREAPAFEVVFSETFDENRLALAPGDVPVDPWPGGTFSVLWKTDGRDWRLQEGTIRPVKVENQGLLTAILGVSREPTTLPAQVTARVRIGPFGEAPDPRPDGAAGVALMARQGSDEGFALVVRVLDHALFLQALPIALPLDADSLRAAAPLTNAVSLSRFEKDATGRDLWLKLRLSGPGPDGQAPRLQGKAWLDQTPEPAEWMIQEAPSGINAAPPRYPALIASSFGDDPGVAFGEVLFEGPREPQPPISRAEVTSPGGAEPLAETLEPLDEIPEPTAETPGPTAETLEPPAEIPVVPPACTLIPEAVDAAETLPFGARPTIIRIIKPNEPDYQVQALMESRVFLESRARSAPVPPCVEHYEFPQPARFTLPAFGPHGLAFEEDGAWIAEGMRLVVLADGRYQVRFVVSTPAMPVQLRLRLLLAEKSFDPLRPPMPITLPTIDLPPFANSEGRFEAASWQVILNGYHEAFRHRLTAFDWGRTRRDGSARFGSYPTELSSPRY